MTPAKLLNHLQNTGLPVAYHHFNTPPKPPYLVYLFAYSSDFMADNINYHEISDYQIELYTTKKDLVSESLVEDKLKELKIIYSKIETYIETEGLFQVIYDIKI